MKQGDRKYEDRIFGHKKNGTGRHRGILGTKKPAKAGIEEFWAQKNRLKPAAWMVRLSGLEPPTPTMSR